MSQPSLLSSAKQPLSSPHRNFTSGTPAAAHQNLSYFSGLRMYDNALHSVFLFLSPSELAGISRVNRRFNDVARPTSFLWSRFLKPEAFVANEEVGQAGCLTAKKSCENPGNRKDKYVPSGKAGLDYLNALGITNDFLIECIEHDILTIADVKQNIDAWPVGALENAVIRKNIYQKNITLETALRLPQSAINVIIMPGVQKYIDNKKLNIQEFINRFVTLETAPPVGVGLPLQNLQQFFGDTLLQITKLKYLAYLNSAGVQKYIDQGTLTVDEIINSFIFVAGIEQLDDPIIQEKISAGRVTPLQVINGFFIFFREIPVPQLNGQDGIVRDTFRDEFLNHYKPGIFAGRVGRLLKKSAPFDRDIAIRFARAKPNSATARALQKMGIDFMNEPVE